MYKDYMSNNQNQIFMSKVSEHISNINNMKKKPEAAYKFMERDSNFQDFDYSDLLKPDKSRIVNDFTKTLESPNLHNEIKRQSTYLNNINNSNILSKSNDLLNEEYAIAAKDGKVSENVIKGQRIR